MKKVIRMTVLAILLAILLFGGCSHKPAIWEIPPATEQASPELMEKIRNAGSRMDYPNAQSIVIEDIDSTIFTPEGNFTLYSYSLVKLTTLKGAKDYGTIGLSYDTMFFKVEIPMARVIKEDGTIINVPDSSITDETIGEMAMMDVFWTNLRQKVVNFQELSSGATIEYMVIYRSLKPRFEGIFDHTHYFQSDEPIKHSRSVVVGPALMPLNWKIRNDTGKLITFTQSKKGDLLKYCWEGWDIPQVILEEGMPPFTDMALVLLSSTTTWKEYSKKVYEYVEPVMQTNQAIEDKVAELTAGKDSEYDKIRAIFYYVAQKIRYLGLAMDPREGIQPHEVIQTFEKQAGVCKDKASLLAAMLQSAGIEAYYVLSNPMNHVDKDVAASQFNHAITLAVTRDGKRYFLDSTDEFVMDMLPAYHQEKAVLVCDEDGEELEYLPTQPPEQNSGLVKINSTIQSGGNLTGTVTLSGKGIYDEVIRQIVRLQEGAQLKKFIERLVYQVNPNARLLDFQIRPEPIMDLYQPAQITINFEIDEYAIVAGKYLLIKPIGLDNSFDIFVNTYLTMFTQLETRQFPLAIQFTSGIVNEEEIVLPGGYLPKVLPQDKNLDLDPASLSMEYHYEGNKLYFKNSLMLNKATIPPEEYPDLRKVKKESSQAASSLAIFVREDEI
ncbi:DUF3857 domain-containing protein [bacterium]|nr:DUF3857 domain-containing protein [bacterium]